MLSLAGDDDYVDIFDGNDVNSPIIIAHINISSGSAVYETTQPYMLVIFKTDSAFVNRGFSATYSSKVTGYAHCILFLS